MLIKDISDVVEPSEHYARMVAVELLVQCVTRPQPIQVIEASPQFAGVALQSPRIRHPFMEIHR